MKHEIQRVPKDIREKLGKNYRWRCMLCGDFWKYSPNDDCPVLDTAERPQMSTCSICNDEIWYQECPTGGWWIHTNHPDDDHDAEPVAIPIHKSPPASENEP